MQVKFSSRKSVAGKWYEKGQIALLADKLAYTSEFKQLVKSGAAIVLPRDQAAQAMQAQRDARSHKLAQAKAPSDSEIAAKAHTTVAAKWDGRAVAHHEAQDPAGAQLARAYADHHRAKAESHKDGKPVPAAVNAAVVEAKAAVDETLSETQDNES